MRPIRRFVFAWVMLAGAVAIAADPKPDEKKAGSPHADALALVMRTQAEVIRDVEAPEPPDGKGDERWWHDVKERSWSVKRPAHPGVVDTTHQFFVVYQIDGKDVAGWMVDTRKGTVEGGKLKREAAPPPRAVGN